MKDLKIFYFPTCPYCKKAKQAVEELQEENPKYREIGKEDFYEQTQAHT